MLHALKTWPSYFEDILEGRKTFEIRKHDRPFNENDDIVLQEYTKDGKYTGREWHGKITYFMNEPEFCKKGFVILGIKPKEQ
jgi:uncharacterized protein DUF3850